MSVEFVNQTSCVYSQNQITYLQNSYKELGQSYGDTSLKVVASVLAGAIWAKVDHQYEDMSGPIIGPSILRILGVEFHSSREGMGKKRLAWSVAMTAIFSIVYNAGDKIGGNLGRTVGGMLGRKVADLQVLVNNRICHLKTFLDQS